MLPGMQRRFWLEQAEAELSGKEAFDATGT